MAVLPMRKIEEVSETSHDQGIRSVRLNDSEKLSQPLQNRHNNSANNSSSSQPLDSPSRQDVCLPTTIISAPAFVGVLAHNSNKEYLLQYGYEQQLLGRASVAHPSPPTSGAGIRITKSDKNGPFPNVNQFIILLIFQENANVKLYSSSVFPGGGVLQKRQHTGLL